MARSQPTLNSYGAHILAALIKGSQEEVQVPLTWRQAVVLRQRLNSLRKLMMDEEHPLAMAVQRAGIAIKWGPAYGLPHIETLTNSKRVTYPKRGDSPVIVYIAPKDDEFIEALKLAGVDTTHTPPLTPNPNPSSTDPHTLPSTFPPSDLAELLAEIDSPIPTPDPDDSSPSDLNPSDL